VAAIATVGTPQVALAAKAATTTIPIVFSEGLVRRLCIIEIAPRRMPAAANQATRRGTSAVTFSRGVNSLVEGAKSARQRQSKGPDEPTSRLMAQQNTGPIDAPDDDAHFVFLGRKSFDWSSNLGDQTPRVVADCLESS